MKRIIYALLLLPQLVYAQYLADVFNLEMSDDVSQMKIGKTFSQDTTLIWGEKSKISGLSISGTVVLNNDNDSYIRVTWNHGVGSTGITGSVPLITYQDK